MVWRCPQRLCLNGTRLLRSPTIREDYGEQRYRAFGFIGNRLYCVVYVDRNEVRRIISLRKANAREVNEYVKANQ